MLCEFLTSTLQLVVFTISCLTESTFFSSLTRAKYSPESVCEVWDFCEHSLLQPSVQIVTASIWNHLKAGIAARWPASLTEISSLV